MSVDDSQPATSNGAYPSQVQYDEPTRFMDELIEGDAIGKCSTPIVDGGCDVISVDGGVRYLFVSSVGVVWMRPDGVSEVTTEEKTRELVNAFDALETVSKPYLSHRVRSTLARYEET